MISDQVPQATVAVSTKEIKSISGNFFWTLAYRESSLHHQAMLSTLISEHVLNVTLQCNPFKRNYISISECVCDCGSEDKSTTQNGSHVTRLCDW